MLATNTITPTFNCDHLTSCWLGIALLQISLIRDGMAYELCRCLPLTQRSRVSGKREDTLPHPPFRTCPRNVPISQKCFVFNGCVNPTIGFNTVNAVIAALILHRDHCHRHLPAMRQAKLHISHPHGSSPFRRPAAEVQPWPLTRLPPYLDLPPAHSAADPGPQGLRPGLLGGKPRRKALGRMLLLALAVGAEIAPQTGRYSAAPAQSPSDPSPGQAPSTHLATTILLHNSQPGEGGSGR